MKKLTYLILIFTFIGYIPLGNADYVLLNKPNHYDEAFEVEALKISRDKDNFTIDIKISSEDRKTSEKYPSVMEIEVSNFFDARQFIKAIRNRNRRHLFTCSPSEIDLKSEKIKCEQYHLEYDALK